MYVMPRRNAGKEPAGGVDNKNRSTKLNSENWEYLKFRDVTYNNYLVYEDGRIWSKKFQRYLKTNKNRNGYHFIHLPNLSASVYIHHVVINTFGGSRPKGMTIDHIDGDKNNNSIDNLEYVTIKENCRRGRALGLNHDEKPVVAFTEEGDYKTWKSLGDAAEELTGSRDKHFMISNVLAGRKKRTMGYMWRFDD